MRSWRLRALAVLVPAALLCGCSTLPDSGPVHTRAASAEQANGPVSYFAPPGPADGDSQEGIVRGFLLAMQANPLSTAVARGFLTGPAKGTWNPSESTVVYDAPTVETVSGHVVAKLRGAYRMSAHGAWLDGTTASTQTIPFSLAQEDGQWRITNPPNLLAVPSSYFSSLFEPFDLYFFDRTGSVLVPAKVYVPRGEDTATNLVRGLLAGPPPDQRPMTTTAFPNGLELDIGVVVNDAGIAEVPMGAGLLDLPPAQLNRVAVQLAWTLRQVPGITRLRLTVNGAPVALADGRTDISVTTGQEYDPAAATRRELLAISGGRVVQDDGDTVTPVAGPFGQPAFALRSLAWSARDHAIAGVSSSGRRVFVAPDRGSRSTSRVRPVLDGAANLLRPAYDRFGDLWLVDATPRGAVVHVIRGRRDRVLRVPGITGQPIRAFTLTRDGTRLVAVLADGSNPTIEVSGLVRDDLGRVRQALPALTRQVNGADLGPARDVVQFDGTSVAVLTKSAALADQVVVVELDGSPGVQESGGRLQPTSVPGALTDLVGSPDTALPLRVIGTDRRLYTFTETGRWTRTTLANVLAATYAQ